MKNVFKFGFLAFAIATSLTACDFFSSGPKPPKPTDSLSIDTTKLDTNKLDSAILDSNKVKADSTVKSNN